MAKSKVSIAKTQKQPDFEGIFTAVTRAIELVGGIRSIVKPGQKVLISPSWVAPVDRCAEAAITLPEVTRAVADIVHNAGARAIIAESAAVGMDTEEVIAHSGYQQLKDMGYELVNLKKTEAVMVPVPDGKIFKEIETFKLVEEADVIIPVAKFKTHAQTEMTLAIKKLKGLLTDKYKRLFHRRGVFESCVDLLQALRPQFALVDGIYCQEGSGPTIGKLVEMDLIVAGRDLVAVDVVCGYIAGFEPDEVPITAEAVRRGLGATDRKDIDVVGKPIESVARRFMRAAEDERLQMGGSTVSVGEDACSGCRLGIMHAIYNLKESGQEHLLSGITIVAGEPEIPYLPSREKTVVTVGKCVPRDKRGERHIKGCPPNIQTIAREIREIKKVKEPR